MGKLRAANNERDEYVLYDNGESYDSKDKTDLNLRAEHGAFTYRYEMCNVGNIRKMKIMFPQLDYNPSDKNNMFTCKPFQPESEKETLLSTFHQN